MRELNRNPVKRSMDKLNKPVSHKNKKKLMKNGYSKFNNKW